MRLLDDLSAMKGRFGRDAAREAGALLERCSAVRMRDPAALIHFHEVVLFLRAYPQSAKVLRLADGILFSFADRLRGDLYAFEDPEISGIAGTGLSTNFSYEIVRGLVTRYPRHISIDWDAYQHADRLGAVLPRLVPESREDFGVLSHPDARRWFARLKGGLKTLLDRVEPKIYDLLEIPVRWELGDSFASRSRTRIPRREIFYHHVPFLKRSEVSIAAEFAEPRIPVTRLDRAKADRILGLIADASAVRYRELYGFTHPDRADVRHADLGRGMDFYFFGVAKNRRLIRDYHGGMYFKNGVPIGYVELMSSPSPMGAVMEVGFNLYYTFREAETAWLYARLLKVFHERLHATHFTIDPYQIGHENEEAVESGAFWFYRKLGFRSTSRDVAKLIEKEEAKIRATPGYRTPAAMLRKLAVAPLVYAV